MSSWSLVTTVFISFSLSFVIERTMFFDSTRKKSVEELFDYFDYSDDEVNDVRWVNDWFFIRVCYIRVHVQKFLRNFLWVSVRRLRWNKEENRYQHDHYHRCHHRHYHDFRSSFFFVLLLLFFFLQFSTNLCDRRRVLSLLSTILCIQSCCECMCGCLCVLCGLRSTDTI